MHYHRPTLRALEQRLEAEGVAFHLFSSFDAAGTVGRVAERKPAVARHEFYSLHERKVGNFTLRMQRGLDEMVARVKPSVVVSMSHSGTPTEWLLQSRTHARGARMVAWQCGYEYNPGRLKDAVLKRFIPRFDYHLCYHSNARDYALRYGARPDQTLVMHNTIDERAILAGDRSEARRTLEARHPALRGKRIVLYVGAVLEEKRLDDVFAALERIGRSDLIFLLVGDGPHLAALRDRHGHRSDWVATGQVIEGVGPYFDAADLFVLPGTGGLAINEAMAHRLPVISSYADGSADDLVRNGETGFRVETGDVAQIADRIQRVLGDADTAQGMGLKGEALIRGELSFQRFIDRVAEGILGQVRMASLRD